MKTSSAKRSGLRLLILMALTAVCLMGSTLAVNVSKPEELGAKLGDPAVREIVLTENLDLTNTDVPVQGSKTLKLNGHTLSLWAQYGQGFLGIKANSNLTVQGPGKIIALPDNEVPVAHAGGHESNVTVVLQDVALEGQCNWPAFVNEGPSSALTFERCTITQTLQNPNYGFDYAMIKNANGGNLEVRLTDTTIKQTGTGLTAGSSEFSVISNKASSAVGGKLTIEVGGGSSIQQEITGTVGSAHVIDAPESWRQPCGALTITGSGTIESSHTAVHVNGNVQGSSISGVRIKGGDGTPESAVADESGQAFGSNMLSRIPDEQGYFTVKEKSPNYPNVAQNVGTGQKYETVQGAIDAAGAGQQIQLLDDTAEAFTVNGEIYLDLNGHTLVYHATGNGPIYALDSTGNNYQVPGGKVRDAGDLLQPYTAIQDATGNQIFYLRYTDSTGTSYHRVSMGINGYQLVFNPNPELGHFVNFLGYIKTDATIRSAIGTGENTSFILNGGQPTLADKEGENGETMTFKSSYGIGGTLSDDKNNQNYYGNLLGAQLQTQVVNVVMQSKLRTATFLQLMAYAYKQPNGLYTGDANYDGGKQAVDAYMTAESTSQLIKTEWNRLKGLSGEKIFQ